MCAWMQSVPTVYARRGSAGHSKRERERERWMSGRGRVGRSAQGHDNTHMYEGMSHTPRSGGAGTQGVPQRPVVDLRSPHKAISIAALKRATRKVSQHDAGNSKMLLGYWLHQYTPHASRWGGTRLLNFEATGPRNSGELRDPAIGQESKQAQSTVRYVRWL